MICKYCTVFQEKNIPFQSKSDPPAVCGVPPSSVLGGSVPSGGSSSSVVPFPTLPFPIHPVGIASTKDVKIDKSRNA